MKLVIIISFLLLFFISCSSDQENENYQDNYSYSVIEPELKHDGIEYHGNIILIDEEITTEGTFNIQKIEKERKGISFSVSEIPNELFLRNKGLKGDELSAALSETSKERIYFFELQRVDGKSLSENYFEDDADRFMQYFSFQCQSDFFLLNENSDTISASFVQYDTDYGISPFERIIVGFNNINESEGYKLLYKDKIFTKENQDFSFAPTSIIEENLNFQS